MMPLPVLPHDSLSVVCVCQNQSGNRALFFLLVYKYYCRFVTRSEESQIRRINQWRQYIYIAEQYNIPLSFSFMLLHLLACICTKKRNFSLWIATAGILSAYVIVVVVVVVYVIRVYSSLFFFLLIYSVDWPTLLCLRL